MARFTFSDTYLNNLITIKKHRDFIDGRVDKVKKYLVRHSVEYSQNLITNGNNKGRAFGNVLFQARLDHLANRNLCEPILVGWLAAITRETMISDELIANEDFKNILYNLDGTRKSIETLIRDTFWEYGGVGLVGVLVEAPLVVATTQEEARERGERSIATIFKAEYILAIERFKNQGRMLGELKRIVLYLDGDDESMRLREYSIENQGDTFRVKDFTLKIKNVLLNTDGTSGTLNTTDLKEVEEMDVVETDGNFDRIPFIIIGEDPGESIIRNIVEQNYEYLNKKSQYDTINRNQCFKRILGIGIQPEEIELWNESVMATTSRSDAKIQTIEPGDPIALEKDLANIERNCYLEGFMRHGARYQLATGQTESAETKREDKLTWFNYLNYVADLLERAANDVIKLLAHYENIELQEVSEPLKISREFDNVVTQEQLNRADMLYRMADDFGEAGGKAKARIFNSMLAEIRLLPEEGKTEEEIKADIQQEILDSPPKAPQSSFSINSNIIDEINGSEVSR